MRYRKIAVAAGFSPTLPAVLAETARMAAAFDADWQLIHAAEECPEKAAAFAQIYSEFSPLPRSIHWSPGETPLAGILAAVQSGGYDLLICGALEREPEHRTFLGSVARGLMNELCCDKLFLSRPRITPRDCQKLIIAIEPRAPGQKILSVAGELCQALPFAEVTVTGTDSLFATASGINPREVIQQIAESLQPHLPATVDWHCVQSNTGFGLCDFVQGADPDLLVTAASLEKGRYVLPTHLSWLHQVIPCNTLIVRD